jgi:hypothetical protein
MTKIKTYLQDFLYNLTRKKIIIFLVIVTVTIGGFFVFSYLSKNKQVIAISSLNALGKVSRFLPISKDEQQELSAVNTIVKAFTQNDDEVKTFLILLQNNAELRPGGGFLGQYAIVKIKNGNLVSTLIEDANLLDQRIKVKVSAPFPFQRMMQIKNWKFRDSNFSPDFPTNVAKAKYFFRLAGGNSNNFDGVIAVNSQVFDDIFTLIGPITVPGYSGEFNSENASRKLEEIVEKAYIMDPKLDTQNRKAILKSMAPIIMNKLFTLGNITKIASFFHNEMKNRNMMLNFTDTDLQKTVESVYWDGSVPQDWSGDYLMAVDANMGALKTDYYMRREMNYDLDFTQTKPTVTLNVKYENTAPYGNWRTSDYHAYLRVYVPKGSEFVSSNMVSHLMTGDEFNKTYFGFKVDVVMGRTVDGKIVYTLPDSITVDDYKLLIQKQSGAGGVPVTVHIRTSSGEENQQQTLQNDLRFEYSQQ